MEKGMVLLLFLVWFQQNPVEAKKANSFELVIIVELLRISNG